MTAWTMRPGGVFVAWFAALSACSARHYDPLHKGSTVTPARAKCDIHGQPGFAQRCGTMTVSRSAVLDGKQLSHPLRFRGGAEEKIEGDCIGIDLGTTCVRHMSPTMDLLE